MEKIYLLTNDGYLDSLSTDYFAEDEEGIKRLVTLYQMKYFSEDIRNVTVDFVKKEVYFESRPNWASDEDDWDKRTYHFFCIKKIKED